MYLKFYDLTKKPFQLTPDPYFLYLSQSHKEAIGSIAYAISERKGFMALFGEVGTGKTTIVRTYLARANRKVVKPIYIFDPNLTFQDLVRTILFELGEEPAKGPSLNLTRQLSQVLIEQYQKGAIVVLIIDESHLMPDDTLEKLRLLSNLETAENKLIQVIMAGPPEFEERIKSPELRQLNQRFAVKSRIQLLQREDSLLYISHRISRAGAVPESLFTREAINAIVDAAQGSPRVLNILCDNALVTSFAYEERPVSLAIAQEVIADHLGDDKVEEQPASLKKKTFPMPVFASPDGPPPTPPGAVMSAEPSPRSFQQPPFLFGATREQEEEKEPAVAEGPSKVKEIFYRVFTTQEPNGRHRVSPVRVLAMAGGVFVLFLILNGGQTKSAQPAIDTQPGYTYQDSRPAYTYSETAIPGSQPYQAPAVKKEEPPSAASGYGLQNQVPERRPDTGVDGNPTTGYSAPLNAFMGNVNNTYEMAGTPGMMPVYGETERQLVIADSTLLKTVQDTAPAAQTDANNHHIPNFPVVRTVRKGDSLSELCTQVYGTSKAWVQRRVMEYNPDISSTNEIKVGFKIYFPELGEAPQL